MANMTWSEQKCLLCPPASRKSNCKMDSYRNTSILASAWRCHFILILLLPGVLSTISCSRGKPATTPNTPQATVDSTKSAQPAPSSVPLAKPQSKTPSTKPRATAETKTDPIQSVASRKGDANSRRQATVSADPSDTDPKDTAIVYRNARSAQQKARVAAEHSQLTTAYTEALNAWQSLKDISNDRNCQAFWRTTQRTRIIRGKVVEQANWLTS